MAGFNGKWRLTNVNNAQGYFDAIKSPEEYKAKLHAIADAVKTNPEAYIEQLAVDKEAGTIQRIVIINGETKKDSGIVKVGAEIEHPAADGRPAKVKVVIDSDTKITRTETGDGFSTSTTFELSGDTMTATSTGNGVSSTMTYQRV